MGGERQEGNEQGAVMAEKVEIFCPDTHVTKTERTSRGLCYAILLLVSRTYAVLGVETSRLSSFAEVAHTRSSEGNPPDLHLVYDTPPKKCWQMSWSEYRWVLEAEGFPVHVLCLP